MGIVLLPQRTWRRRLPEWLNDDLPFRYRVSVRGELPRRLQDGESARGFAHLDHTIDEFHGRDGIAYSYVLGSGTVYLARDSDRWRKLRARRRIGER
jgi:hypothetical protein